MSKRETFPALRVGLVRLSEASAAMIGMAFERFARSEFTVVEPSQAQLLIVDADRLLGSDTVAALRTDHPKLPFVLLGAQGSGDGNSIVLTKPIGVQSMLEALRGIHLRMIREEQAQTKEPAPRAAEAAPVPRHGYAGAARHHGVAKAEVAHTPARQPAKDAHPQPESAANAQAAAGPIVLSEDCCGDAPDLAPDPAQRSPEGVARSFYDDQAGLLALVRNAVRYGTEQRKNLTVTGLASPLYIQVEGAATAVTELDDGILRRACGEELAQQQYYTIAALPQMARGWRREAADALLWKLALWSSKGRLPRNTDPDCRVRMSRWPNFTRLLITPHAVRAAALWVTRDLSPIELASALRVPQRYIFALYAAASNAGLMEKTLAAAPAPELPPPQAPRGLLSRILGRLISGR